ncbi:NADPH-dependent FMN reductase [Nonomuraea sp. KM88]|uniref:NADPH-dependent FMN reductase n=1 Tax=Nonomuraea sp. KM88 TaxID=3457427 RepID=UPI003FCEAD9B
MKLLTISGSLRTGSFNTQLLTHAEDLARDAGHQVHRSNRVSEIPPFNEDHEQRPVGVVEDLRAEVRHSDAVLIATPEYSGSIPGQLKNLLDWAARPDGACVFTDLPVAVISASPGKFGAAWAREATEHILTQMGATVLSTGWGLPLVHERAAGNTGLIDDDAENQLRTIIGRLAEALNGPGGQDAEPSAARHRTAAVVGA